MIPEADLREVLSRVDYEQLAIEDGLHVVKGGGRSVCACPFHADRSPSCVLFDDGYHCFGCGAHGDAIEWRRKTRNLTFLEAFESLSGHRVLPQRPAKRGEKVRKYHPILPVPANAPPCRYRHPQHGEAHDVRTYRSALGETLLVDARYWMLDEAGAKIIDGEGNPKKAVVTWCWASDTEGSTSWRMTRPSNLLPLYGLDRLAARPDATVLLVEGAKKADHAADLLPDLVPISWCGGSKNILAADKNDLEPLRGRTVVLWPDRDKSGANAMRLLAQYLSAIGATVRGVVDLRDRTDLKQAFDVGDVTDATAAALMLATEISADGYDWWSLIDLYPGKIDKSMVKDRPTETVTKQTVADDQTEPPTPPTTNNKPTDPADDDRDIERGDIANATRFVAMHGDRLRHCADIDVSNGGRWYVWTGKHWQHDVDGEVIRLAELTAKQIAREFLAEADELFNEAKDCDDDEAGKAKAKAIRSRAYSIQKKAETIQSRRKLLDMVSLAQSRRGIASNMNEFDRADYLINCANGIIDLRDGRLFKHAQKHMMSMLSPVKYNPDADRKRLMQVVEHVTNYDPEVALYAQSILGNSIIGNNRLEKFYLWIGPGRSGKGTLLESVKSALGSYCMTAESKSFTQVQGSRIRDDLDRLKWSRLTLSSEINRGESLDAAILKNMSGGDTMATRQLYGSYQEFRPRMTLHLQANDRPRIDDQDGAMWERLCVIPCGPTVPESERDPGLKEWLLDPEKGGEAVLAWLVEGAARTHALKRIEMPAAVKAACLDYRTDQDPTKDFMEEGLRFATADHHAGTFCLVRDVINAYHKFCHERHVPEKFRVSEQNLAKRLEAKGAARKKRRIESKPESTWTGFTLADREHVCAGLTLTPSDDEHATVLGLFLSSQVPAVLQTPTRAHAHARPSHVDTFQTSKNTGTQEQEIKPELPGQLDLSDLDGGPT